MSIGEFRELSDFEKKILERLLQQSFLGGDAIREQIKNCRVRTLDIGVDNYGSIEFKVFSEAKADVNQRVPVEAVAHEGKVPVLVLLHVVDGKINELEFVKMDGSPIDKMPSPSEFKVKVRK